MYFAYTASNFKTMRGLDGVMAQTVLQGVISKEMSIQEMINECREIKKMKELQEVFVKETGVASWDEAEIEFPVFTTAEALDEFKKCSFKNVPQRYILNMLVICDVYVIPSQIEGFLPTGTKEQDGGSIYLRDAGSLLYGKCHSSDLGASTSNFIPRGC